MWALSSGVGMVPPLGHDMPGCLRVLTVPWSAYQGMKRATASPSQCGQSLNVPGRGGPVRSVPQRAQVTVL